MPRFKVLARDGSGNRVQQTIEAVNQNEARAELRRRNLTALSVVEDTAKAAKAAVGAGEIKYKWGGLIGPPVPRFKSQDLVVFTRQFATMISAGIPVLECLDILTEQAEDPGFKLIMTRVVEDLRGGVDLSAALAKHRRIFTNIYTNMIRAGEASGQLDEILLRLAEYMESSEKLKQRIKSAMTYPVVSMCLVLLIAAALLIFIIPQFETIFIGLLGSSDALPLPTKVVLAMSTFIRSRWYVVVFIPFGIWLPLRAWKKTKTGAYMWDRLMLTMPVFGTLVGKIALSRFSQTFSTLLRSGVNILGALDIVAATSGNMVVERAVLAARESIRAGEPLARPLSESPVFPPMVVRMVAIGEKSGALESLLEKIAQFYDEQVAASIESLTALIEPLMIGVMGTVVGGMVLAVFLPIFTIQGEMSK
jgi:type IV pilus assembly protein PilC